MKVRRIDFSPDEWLVGTNSLGNAERGLYITACAMIYSHGGPIDRTDLRDQCRDHGLAFNRQLETLLRLGKLSVNDGRITNKRCENELRKAHKRSENSKQNVSKRWKNNGLDADPVLPSRAGNHQPSTTNHQLPKKDSRSSAAADGDFEAWWKEVPRKVGKGQARRAYSVALKKAPKAILLSAITSYAAARAGQDEQFTAHPATWLNGERWLDGNPPAEQQPRRPRTPPPLDDLNEPYRPDRQISEPGALPIDEKAAPRHGSIQLH